MTVDTASDWLIAKLGSVTEERIYCPILNILNTICPTIVVLH